MKTSFHNSINVVRQEGQIEGESEGVEEVKSSLSVNDGRNIIEKRDQIINSCYNDNNDENNKKNMVRNVFSIRQQSITYLVLVFIIVLTGCSIGILCSIAKHETQPILWNKSSSIIEQRSRRKLRSAEQADESPFSNHIATPATVMKEKGEEQEQSQKHAVVSSLSSLSGFRNVSVSSSYYGNIPIYNDDSNDDNDEDNVVVFWHVPKSGGSTVKNILGMCHRLRTASSTGIQEGHHQDSELALVAIGGDTSDPNRPKQYVNVDMSTFEGIHRAKQMGLAQSGLADLIVTSHLYNVNGLFDERHKGKLFGVFRHPVDRIVSLFNYLGYAKWERTYNPALANMSLHEFAQTKDDGDANVLVQSNWVTRYLSNQLWGELTETHFQIARNILHRKFIIGLTDKMEESIERFERIFKWTFRVNPSNQEVCRAKLLKEPSNPNPQQEKYEIPHRASETYKLLATKNSYDMRLYEYIEELFLEQRRLVAQIPENFRLVNASCCKCNTPPTC